MILSFIFFEIKRYPNPEIDATKDAFINPCSNPSKNNWLYSNCVNNIWFDFINQNKHP